MHRYRRRPACPLTDSADRDNWRYTLFREAAPVDVVCQPFDRETAVNDAMSPGILQKKPWNGNLIIRAHSLIHPDMMKLAEF